MQESQNLEESESSVELPGFAQRYRHSEDLLSEHLLSHTYIEEAVVAVVIR